jgi:hypothetical protein
VFVRAAESSVSRGFEGVAVLLEPVGEGLELGVELADLRHVAVAGEAFVVFGVELELVRL